MGVSTGFEHSSGLTSPILLVFVLKKDLKVKTFQPIMRTEESFWMTDQTKSRGLPFYTEDCFVLSAENRSHHLS